MYKHFGRIGDVWKHFPLVDVLDIERPLRYVETNSSRAEHQMDDDWRRKLGIGHFLLSEEASDRKYISYEKESVKKGIYLGSSALAMKLLGNSCDQYVFCDLDQPALDNIKNFSRRLGLDQRIQTICGDSRSSLYDQMKGWGQETFVHIDPYEVLTKNENSHSYCDLFFDLASKGVKVLLWYGYDTIDLRETLNQIWSSRLKDIPGCGKFEVEVENFEHASEEANPGIWGCGILAGNLSQESIARIKLDHEVFCNHYRQVELKGNVYHYSGKL